jgi:hypothetical protein
MSLRSSIHYRYAIWQRSLRENLDKADPGLAAVRKYKSQLNFLEKVLVPDKFPFSKICHR